MIQPHVSGNKIEATTTATHKSRLPQGFFVSVLSAAVIALGVLNLWSSLLAHGPGRAALLRYVIHMPWVIEHGSRTLTAVFGICLIMLGRSLLRRKRQAWLITVLLVVPSPFLHIVKGLDWEEAMICMVMLGCLLYFRRSFYAENDRPSARHGILAAIALFTFAVVYGPVGYILLRHEFKQHVTIRLAVLESTHELFSAPEDPVLATKHLHGRAVWFEDSLLCISSFALCYGLIMLLRPVLPRGVIEEMERRKAKELLKNWGGAPLSYFSLLPDKRYLFDTADHPNWAISYRVVGRIAVALGDPLGSPEMAKAAINGFIDYCQKNDWRPVFYQVTSHYISLYKYAGMKTFKIGEDAIIDLTAFTLKGKAFQDLRTAINKMNKAGVVFEEYDTNDLIAYDTLTQLTEITEDWLNAHHGEEKGFAMGQFAPATDLFRDSRLFIARDSETNVILAFVTFVPIFGKASETVDYKQGWGLDLMRRRTASPNGVMDYLIASSAVKLQSEGAEIISLGLSPLADTDECIEDDEWMEKLRSLLFERFNHFYHFKGLNAFKAKFSPNWESRFVVFPKAVHLPTVAYAIVRAHASRRLRYIFGFVKNKRMQQAISKNQ